MQRYSVNQQLIETVLASVKGGEIAIPEIQQPFVWDSSKVHNLMELQDYQEFLAMRRVLMVEKREIMGRCKYCNKLCH